MAKLSRPTIAGKRVSDLSDFRMKTQPRLYRWDTSTGKYEGFDQRSDWQRMLDAWGARREDDEPFKLARLCTCVNCLREMTWMFLVCYGSTIRVLHDALEEGKSLDWDSLFDFEA